jgi:hypothetical protein
MGGFLDTPLSTKWAITHLKILKKGDEDWSMVLTDFLLEPKRNELEEADGLMAPDTSDN